MIRSWPDVFGLAGFCFVLLSFWFLVLIRLALGHFMCRQTQLILYGMGKKICVDLLAMSEWYDSSMRCALSLITRFLHINRISDGIQKQTDKEEEKEPENWYQKCMMNVSFEHCIWNFKRNTYHIPVVYFVCASCISCQWNGFIWDFLW